MLVITQHRLRAVNLDQVEEISYSERSVYNMIGGGSRHEYIIRCTPASGRAQTYTLGIYRDQRTAARVFAELCQAAVDGDGLYEMPEDK